MRKTLLIGTSALCMAMSAQAFAACEISMQELNNRFMVGQSTERQAVASVSGELRKLRDAAMIFKRNGMEDACQSVVADINGYIEVKKDEYASSDTAVGYDEWRTSETERVRQAEPVTDRKMQLRADDIVDADLRNMKNQDLGEIDDVVLQPNGEVKYLLVSHGGFFGFGDKQVAIPWKTLRVTADKSDPVFVLNVSQDALDEAPTFEHGTWSDIGTDKWRMKNDEFYKDMQMLDMSEDSKLQKNKG